MKPSIRSAVAGGALMLASAYAQSQTRPPAPGSPAKPKRQLLTAESYFGWKKRPWLHTTPRDKIV
jgi:hypothetical protein